MLTMAAIHHVYDKAFRSLYHATLARLFRYYHVSPEY
jgi:hypothetical protein